jgi:flagellar hook-associated protein 1 FlgK
MAQNPSDPGTRQTVVATSRSLANAFQSARGGLESARSGADAELAGSVGEINSLAKQVADLNAQVRTASVGGGTPNDLLDARQKAVDRLAELTGASPVANSSGDVSLFLPGGSAIVSDLQAATLGTQADLANAGHLKLTLSGPNGSARAFTGIGGHLGGVLAARDGALKTAVDGLDALAWDLGNAVNTVHQAGYGLDGTTGDQLFTMGPTQAGAAAAIGVNAAILADPRRLAAASALTSPTSAAPGDATNLQRLVATERAALSNGLTATDGVAKITSDFGSAAKSTSVLADHDKALHDHLLTMRDAASGVSIDDELIALQKAQRGYQAISRVIQTSSDMLDILMTLKAT